MARAISAEHLEDIRRDTDKSKEANKTSENDRDEVTKEYVSDTESQSSQSYHELGRSQYDSAEELPVDDYEEVEQSVVYIRMMCRVYTYPDSSDTESDNADTLVSATSNHLGTLVKVVAGSFGPLVQGGVYRPKYLVRK